MKYQNIYEEYVDALKEYNRVSGKISSLPDGYLTSRTIKNKKYYYLQRTSNGKKSSQCLPFDKVQSVQTGIEQRKSLLTRLSDIESNISRLESAVKILDTSLLRHFYFTKQCYQMDNLPHEQRSRALKFAKAMTSFEGLPVSCDVDEKLSLWTQGKMLFSEIYLPALHDYGVLKNA